MNKFKKSVARLVHRMPFYISHLKLAMIYFRYRKNTMIPPVIYIHNLSLVENHKHLNGNIIECGTWRGGMIAGIGNMLSDNSRKYYIYDSFEGLPSVRDIDGESALAYQNNIEHPHYYDNCAVEMTHVQKAVVKAGMKNVNITKGWFKDTLKNYDKKQDIAILRLDGDFYDSTTQCLEELYDSVIEGGIIIIDDYFAWEGCARAVHDFLSKRGLSDQIKTWNNSVCYIEKTGKEYDKSAYSTIYKEKAI